MLLLLCALLAFCRATGGQLCLFFHLEAIGGGRPEERRRLRTIDAAGLGRQCPNVVPILGSCSNFIDRTTERDERRLTTEKDETTDGDGPPLPKQNADGRSELAGTSGRGTAGVRS